MKISRNWLQTYFEQELPSAEALSDALTFHAFEIDGVETVGADQVLDVKVTPNRGHDCLSHIGIAKELSAILRLPLKHNPLSQTTQSEGRTWPSGPERPSGSVLAEGVLTDAVNDSGLATGVTVSIENPALCRRYVAGYITGVKVGPSPAWLKERLEAIGQRSINNVVDATNYVMFDLGQPLHAFDAGKLASVGPSFGGEKNYAISVRLAKDGEQMIALDKKEYVLAGSMLVIADTNAGVPVGIAGVKGGMPASITEETTDVIIESANFDGASVRKTAQQLKLRTDASARYEQGITPELAAYGMRAVVDRILELAGGTVVEIVDVYPTPQEQKPVVVTLEHLQHVLGAAMGGTEVADALTRLGLAFEKKETAFVVTPSLERLDLLIPEDVIEEVGRIVGYEKIPALPLPPPPVGGFKSLEINKSFYWSEKIREHYISQGYSEVFTSVFADRGERVVLNKVDGVKPYLRQSLVPGLEEALAKNIHNKELLGLKEIKLFEIGVVWREGKEQTMFGHIATGESGTEIPLADTEVAKEFPEPKQYEDFPLSQTERYQSFSKYPYIVRDVAVWTPAGTDGKEVEKQIKNEAGELCVKIFLFDRFEKGDKVSLAYRIIFQSFDRTLVEEEVNVIMGKISATLQARGFEIR